LRSSIVNCIDSSAPAPVATPLVRMLRIPSDGHVDVVDVALGDVGEEAAGDGLGASGRNIDTMSS
jgi:hypothetical protein